MVPRPSTRCEEDRTYPIPRSLVTVVSELTWLPNFYSFHLTLIRDNSRNGDQRNIIRWL